MTSIFSTYSTGENRVTASFLAVLRSLSLDRMQRLIGSLLEQSEFELIRFENQPSKGGAGVPDAIIQSSIRLLLETKTERDAIRLPQIKRHLERLDEATEAVAILLVLTPDDMRPSELDKMNDSRVVWTSFSILDQAIDEMLDDKYEVVSEREAFLLRALQTMLAEEKLLANPNDVVIVAARSAWPEYNELHAYVCQPNRPFQQVTRLGFYSKGSNYPLVPKILATHDEVEMVKNRYDSELGDCEAKVSGTENTSPEDKDKNSPRTASKHFSDLQGDWIIESFYFDEDTNSRELQKQAPGPITLGALRIDDNQLLLRGPSVAGMTRTAAGFSLKPVEGNARGRFVIVNEPETQGLKDEPLRFGMYKVVGDKLTILMTNAKPPKTLAPQKRGWYYEAHRAVSRED